MDRGKEGIHQRTAQVETASQRGGKALASLDADLKWAELSRGRRVRKAPARWDLAIQRRGRVVGVVD